MKNLRNLSVLAACCAMMLFVAGCDKSSSTDTGAGGNEAPGELPEGSNAELGGTEAMPIDE